MIFDAETDLIRIYIFFKKKTYKKKHVVVELQGDELALIMKREVNSYKNMKLSMNR